MARLICHRHIHHMTKILYNNKQLNYQQCRTIFNSSNNNNIQQYDITIIGGGMVGATLACALSQHEYTKHLKVALIDKQSFDVPHDISQTPNIRVSSITPYNVHKFKQYDIWNNIKRKNKFNRMYVYECYNDSHIEWNADRLDTDVLGYIVENDLLQYALYSKLQNSNSNVKCIGNIDIVKIGHSYKNIIPSDYNVIKLSNNDLISSKLLIGADGNNSLVKQYANISSYGYDYNQHAVVCNVKLAQSHTTAYQRFLPYGPVACLPCHDTYSNIVWSTTPQHAKYLKEITNEQFLQEFNNAYSIPSGKQWRNGNLDKTISFIPSQISELSDILFAKPLQHKPPEAIEVIGKRLSFPLRFIHNETYTSNRIALTGDASHVIHPLAGQGVNLGLNDVWLLIDAISQAIQTGQDIGDTNVLKQYNNKAIKHNLALMTGIDTIGRMYSVNNGGLPLLRASAINIFNSIPLLRDTAAKIAMGLYTDDKQRQASINTTVAVS